MEDSISTAKQNGGPEKIKATINAVTQVPGATQVAEGTQASSVSLEAQASPGLKQGYTRLPNNITDGDGERGAHPERNADPAFDRAIHDLVPEAIRAFVKGSIGSAIRFRGPSGSPGAF